MNKENTQSPKAPRKPSPRPTIIRRGSVSVSIYSRSRTVGDTEYNESIVCHYDASGRRVRKTFADPTKARLEAELIAAKLSQGQGDVLELTASDREQYLHATRVLAPLNLGLAAVADDYLAARSRMPSGVSLLTAVDYYVARHRIQSKPVAQVVNELLEDRRSAGCTEVHIRDLKTRLKRVTEKFPGDISKITAAQIREFLRNLTNDEGRPLSNRTRHNFQTIINSLLHFARKQRYVVREIVDEVAEIEFPKVIAPEVGIFTPEQMESILKEAADDLIPALVMGAFCGLRTAELSRIDWKEVKLSERVLIVSAAKAKTASRRVVPIPENCLAWLSPRCKVSGLVSPTPIDNALGDRFERTSARAGVKWVKNGLRHSFCSYRLAVTHDPARVATEAGNSTSMIHKHYKALVTEVQGLEWFALKPNPKS